MAVAVPLQITNQHGETKKARPIDVAEFDLVMQVWDCILLSAFSGHHWQLNNTGNILKTLKFLFLNFRLQRLGLTIRNLVLERTLVFL